MKWIDIPAKRILEITAQELIEFELIDKNGEEIALYVAYEFELARRKKDGRLFRKSELKLNNGLTSMFYLEEV